MKFGRDWDLPGSGRGLDVDQEHVLEGCVHFWFR